MEKSYSESYAAAGVDITAGYRSVELMKQYVARTMNEHCIGGLGGFGGLFVQRGNMQFVHDGQKRVMKKRMREKISVPAAAVIHMRRMARARSLTVASVRPVPIHG